MRSLIHWDRTDPFRELEELGARWGRLLGRSTGREGREGVSIADWMPSVDIVEDDKQYLIKAELPEVEKKDVHVTLQDGILTIAGQRTQEDEEKNKRFHRVERAYGAFSRSFALPSDAAEDQVNAEFKNGMLLVRVMKTAKAQPKPIEVKVA
jgi:HSP20 family protein